jgi:hypothetical protein
MFNDNNPIEEIPAIQYMNDSAGISIPNKTGGSKLLLCIATTPIQTNEYLWALCV